MFRTLADQTKYILENYPEVSSDRFDDEHWDIECDQCKITRGFQVVSRVTQNHRTKYGPGNVDLYSPVSYFFCCPVCKAHKLWIVFHVIWKKKGEDGAEKSFLRYFRVTSLPGEGLEDIEELPTEPVALRVAYTQAIRAMDANAHLAAAAMFRRALQVITRDILGAKPASLASELREVVGKTYNGVTITTNFADVGYIVKEAGNQGAHPDGDPDLLDFTSQDASDLQAIFMELVSELFIVPAAVKKAKVDFLARRKITPKS